MALPVHVRLDDTAPLVSELRQGTPQAQEDGGCTLGAAQRPAQLPAQPLQQERIGHGKRLHRLQQVGHVLRPEAPPPLDPPADDVHEAIHDIPRKLCQHMQELDRILGPQPLDQLGWIPQERLEDLLRSVL
eukprot:CAMPEP_0179164500 /NCGR_PEP_ID=MMETSP0796-20121207/80732_1 /TAXON_ID=73915 /ORGANISM="Pyrodinium bahamense, Strain pbaha01" /LENGTH=130 /DNA_ID=CAMNT_0020866953 /DNA_START=121 /DNA_END=510 /DNA_ORIENTATION=+